MKIGIDQMAFATTPYYIELSDLAAARGVDPNKFKIGIGQDRQAVVPPTQDMVTLGAAAAKKLPKNALRRGQGHLLAHRESTACCRRKERRRSPLSSSCPWKIP